MILGQLKAALEDAAQIDEEAECVFSDGRTSPRLYSWRGVYAMPTLSSSWSGDMVTVKALLEEVKEALAGKIYKGYKGGDFTYNESSPVWADESSEYSRKIVKSADFHRPSWRFVIEVDQLPDEYSY